MNGGLLVAGLGDTRDKHACINDISRRWLVRTEPSPARKLFKVAAENQVYVSELVGVRIGVPLSLDIAEVQVFGNSLEHFLVEHRNLRRVAHAPGPQHNQSITTPSLV